MQLERLLQGQAEGKREEGEEQGMLLVIAQKSTIKGRGRAVKWHRFLWRVLINRINHCGWWQGRRIFGSCLQACVCVCAHTPVSPPEQQTGACKPGFLSNTRDMSAPKMSAWKMNCHFFFNWCLSAEPAWKEGEGRARQGICSGVQEALVPGNCGAAGLPHGLACG